MPSPRYWREIPNRYRLEAARCSACGAVLFPPRSICAQCRSDQLARFQLSRKGKVVTTTVVHVPPGEFLMEAPYAMAVVETPEGARLMVQVVDCDPAEVRPDMEVSLEFRLIRREGHSGILCYGHKGVPVA
ncbi:MAG: Zn-ribbon domain-containing OB-fold protein [Gemmatimonadota bacterium]|nr:MAG: Zn-ribbon domain-containing OB-fold protein [Gemmatimonadota bacterium]